MGVTGGVDPSWGVNAVGKRQHWLRDRALIDNFPCQGRKGLASHHLARNPAAVVGLE